jgi:hypothetical protein
MLKEYNINKYFSQKRIILHSEGLIIIEFFGELKNFPHQHIYSNILICRTLIINFNHVIGAVMDLMQLGKPDESGRREPEPVPNKEFKIECSSVLLAVGRGPNSFLQKKAGIKTGKKGSVAVDNQYKTLMKGVFAAGDVTTGESLVVKAMGSGREAAQRLHEYMMNLEQNHMSFYVRMLEDGADTGSPPQ